MCRPMLYQAVRDRGGRSGPSGTWAAMRARAGSQAARIAGGWKLVASEGGGATAADMQHLPQSLQATLS